MNEFVMIMGQTFLIRIYTKNLNAFSWYKQHKEVKLVSVPISLDSYNVYIMYTVYIKSVF